MIAPESRFQAVAASLHLLKSAFKKERAAREHIHYIRTGSVRITTTPLQPTSIDGELGGDTPPSSVSERVQPSTVACPVTWIVMRFGAPAAL